MSDDLKNELDALDAALNEGFDSLVTIIQEETDEVLLALRAAGVSQDLVDKVKRMKENVIFRFNAAQADIEDTVTVPPVVVPPTDPVPDPDPVRSGGLFSAPTTPVEDKKIDFKSNKK